MPLNELFTSLTLSSDAVSPLTKPMDVFLGRVSLRRLFSANPRKELSIDNAVQKLLKKN